MNGVKPAAQGVVSDTDAWTVQVPGGNYEHWLFCARDVISMQCEDVLKPDILARYKHQAWWVIRDGHACAGFAVE